MIQNNRFINTFLSFGNSIGKFRIGLFFTLSILPFTNPFNEEELVSLAQLPNCIFFNCGFVSARPGYYVNKGAL